MLFLSRRDVQEALPMDQTIETMKEAYAAISAGNAEVPLRTRLNVERYEGISLIMPAYVRDDDGDSMAVKIVSVFPHNPKRDLPVIFAAVIVIDAITGEPIAIMEGGSLTAIRTGAGSGAATDLLARENSRIAAIFGAGVQARTQLEAICSVRDIETVWVFDTKSSKVEVFIQELAGLRGIPDDLRIAADPQQAVKGADILCLATTSHVPIFQDNDLKSGAHINAVGSYTPEMQEIPGETIKRALVVVDSKDAVLQETGDIIKPLQEGLIREDHIHGEIGDILLDRIPARADDKQITCFKSVGNAVQDVKAAQLALQNAQRENLGKRVTW